MVESNKIKLFDENLLANLISKIKAMKTNKARIFAKESLNLRPYSNALTSVARLLSSCEVCGCINKVDSNFLISTNKNSKSGENRKIIGEKIFKLFNNPTTEEKHEFLRSTILNLAKRKANNNLEIFLANSENELAKFILEEIVKKSSHSCKEINKIIETKEKIAEIIENKNQLFLLAVAETFVYINDGIKIIDLAENNNHELHSFVEFVLANEKTWYDRHQTRFDNLHCELAALERENENISLKEVISNLLINVKNKNFTISKFCCYLCHLAFESLAEAYNQSQENGSSSIKFSIPKSSLNFSYLGNSCTIYPTYKNTLLENSAFSKIVVMILRCKIEKIIEMINEKEYIFKDQKENFIENDKTVSFILENDEFLESIQLIM